MRYSLFVGSTATYDAHLKRSTVVEAFPPAMREAVEDSILRASGVWNGERENVAIYSVDLASDDIAQRIAYAIAIATGNDAVMVTRGATDADDVATFGSLAAYRVAAEQSTTANRTILPYADGRYPSNGVGIRYTPDRRGHVVAWLVNADASVSAVS